MGRLILRNLQKTLTEVASYYPVVTVTGPRQSGKSTLCEMAFPHKPRVSLEPLDVRRYAEENPRGFLAEHQGGAIIDEVQRVPQLLSYLQEEVDQDKSAGRFILTGSQHFGLMEGVSQSLAGRTAVLQLLPLSVDELSRFPITPGGLLEVLWAGAYPRIHHEGIPPQRWYADYVSTYVQRDVRQLLNVGDLKQFANFLRICAGRTAQELRLSTMGSDVGVTHNTVRSWLSVLETSMLCTRIPPFKRNLRRQLIKTPKLHFFDTGLLCYLLGIREPEQLRHHPLRGAIFESWVVAEIYKIWVHRGLEPPLYHLREARGLEVDLVIERASSIDLVEAKSAETVADDFFTAVERAAELLHTNGEERVLRRHVVYGGQASQERKHGRVIAWDSIGVHDWVDKG